MPEITSNSDPDSPRPWFEFSFDPAAMDVGFKKANGLAAAAWTNATKADEDALPGNSRHAVSLSGTKSSEVHVLLVDVDGNLQFLPQSELPAVCYAHLAWYDPETDTKTELQFTES